MPFTLAPFSEYPGGSPINIVGNKKDFGDKSDFLDAVMAEYGWYFEGSEVKPKHVEETYCRYSPPGTAEWEEGCYILISKGGKGAFKVYNIEI